MLASVIRYLFIVILPCVLLLDDVHLEVLELTHHLEGVCGDSEVFILSATKFGWSLHKGANGLFDVPQLVFDGIGGSPELLEL